MASAFHAWNIYSAQLFPLGYGYPLWHPENDPSIGDVGWLSSDGNFGTLFNTLHEETGPINQSRLPPSTEKLPKTILIRPSRPILQRALYSRTIQTIEMGGDVSGGSDSANAGGGFAFKTTTDCGAFVMLEPPAYGRSIESRLHIVNLMRNNINSWLEYANDTEKYGLGLRDRDLMFVSGTTKTTHWGVAAFQGDMYRKQEGHIHGDIGPYATAKFSMSIAKQVLPTSFYRYGPEVSTTPVESATGGDASNSKPDEDTNQCLFIHYYKMARRVPWIRKTPLFAGAGPHQLPPGPDNSGMHAPVLRDVSHGGNDIPEHGEVYDPVNHLLDYILLHSDAEVAIASDTDLVAIFAGPDFPDCISAALEKVLPRIEVDEHGGQWPGCFARIITDEEIFGAVGVVSVEENWDTNELFSEGPGLTIPVVPESLPSQLPDLAQRTFIIQHLYAQRSGSKTYTTSSCARPAICSGLLL